MDIGVLFYDRRNRARCGRWRKHVPFKKTQMVLDSGSPAALLYEIPSLRINREPWMPPWHPGFVELVYAERPTPATKHRRELCAVAAIKRRRHCRPVPKEWVHPWTVAARQAGR